MNIAVIGTGNVGSILGCRLAQQGYAVIFGTRDPRAPKISTLLEQAGENAQAATVTDAVAGAAVIILAVPYNLVGNILKNVGPLEGKIIVDTTNPLKPDLSGLDVEGADSAGENVARWAPGANVVKAFNTIGTRVMESPQYGDDRAILLICGDNTEAKDATRQLGEALGFEVLDAGALAMSRYLESMAMLWINLAFVQNMGTDFGLKILTR